MKRGQTIKYEKDIMFKGTEIVTAKIIGITSLNGIEKILLDNGDVMARLK